MTDIAKEHIKKALGNIHMAIEGYKDTDMAPISVRLLRDIAEILQHMVEIKEE